MKKASYGFNAHRQRRRAKTTPEEKAELRAAKSRERVEALAALARMQATPAIAGKVTKLKRAQADAYARRNGMRPLKPPPVEIPPRTTTAAQRDAAAWNAGQIAPLIGLDFLTNAHRR
jgi:hypothetical protein